MEREDWLQALSRTRQKALGRLSSWLGIAELTPESWEALEGALIQADVGVDLALSLVEEIRDIARREGLTRSDQLQLPLRAVLLRKLERATVPSLSDRPTVVMVVGVNGSGKTTTVARLARWWQKHGVRSLLAAADTFRAAGGEQLEIWGERLGIDVISAQPKSDPAAVVYSAAQAAISRQVDLLIVDSSGRMHTRHNLMEELQKMCRVAGKIIPDAPHHVFLVLDATTGQNGLSQANAFADAVPLTGVVLAKLDSSARGGVGFAIMSQLGLPISFVGLGEGPEDFAPFDAEAFVDGLIGQGTPERAG